MSRAAATIELDLPAVVPFLFPLKGIVETAARVAQEPGTAPDLLNVIPYDAGGLGRARGGVRPGLTRSGTNAYGGGGTSDCIVQWMQQLTVEVGSAAGSGAATQTAGWQYLHGDSLHLWVFHSGSASAGDASAQRADFLSVIAGGVAYYGTSSATLAAVTAGAAGTNRVQAGVFVMGAVLDGKQYLLDGTGIKGIDYTGTAPAWFGYSATAGISPGSLKPRLCCVYRKRLVLAATTDGNPENFYGSAVGDPTNWNYSAPGPDRAWSGNDAKTGQPGDPITALIPLGDDALVIGCDRSIWMMNGDISFGGVINVVSRGVGMVSQTGHCFDPAGDLYFVGNNAFYRLTRGTYQLEDLSSDSYPSWFRQTQPTGTYTCVYDKDRHGILLCRTPYPKAGGPPDQLWYDVRTGGFFRLQFPATVGPLRGVLFEHAGSTLARELVLAGYPSAGGTNALELYVLDSGSATDNGTQIQTLEWRGPVMPNGPVAPRNALLSAVDFVMGEIPAAPGAGSWGMSWTLQAGNAPYQAFNAPDFSSSGSYTSAGRQTTVRCRLRGQAFWLKVTNGGSNKAASIDQAAARFRPAGRVRA